MSPHGEPGWDGPAKPRRANKAKPETSARRMAIRQLLTSYSMGEISGFSLTVSWWAANAANHPAFRAVERIFRDALKRCEREAQ